MLKRGWIWRAGLAAAVAALGLAAADAGRGQTTTTTYGYDALGRLQLVARSNGTGVSYAYDAANNRTQRTSCAAGVFLAPGQTLTSPSGHYTLNMQETDGNLVVYAAVGDATWWSGTQGNPGAQATMRADGTLAVLSAQGTVLWASNNFEGPCATLSMQNDGNLVIYDTNHVARWASLNANVTNANELVGGQELIPGQRLVSTDGRFQLQYQNGGNLVILGPGNAILWALSLNNPTPVSAVMQGTDGNFAVYGAGGFIWASGTNGHPGDYMVMQTDGNLVIYAPAGGGVLWQSDTGGH